MSFFFFELVKVNRRSLFSYMSSHIQTISAETESFKVIFFPYNVLQAFYKLVFIGNVKYIVVEVKKIKIRLLTEPVSPFLFLRCHVHILTPD